MQIYGFPKVVTNTQSTKIPHIWVKLIATVTILFNTLLEEFAGTIGEEKEIEDIKIGKETNVSMFTGNMML